MSNSTSVQKGISLERLKAFCLVVRTGSITAAAVCNRNFQSQFSRQIKDLERVFGKKLLRKEGRSLSPTATGMELAALSSAFFAGLEELTQESDKQAIVLAAREGILRWRILPGLAHFSAQGFRWDLKALDNQQVLDALKRGIADIGVVPEGTPTKAFVAESMGAIECVWAFPRKLLPSGTEAGIHNATRLPFAIPAEDGPLAYRVLEIAERNHLQLDICMRLEGFPLLLEAVKTGHIGAVIPKNAAAGLPEAEFAILGGDKFAVSSQCLLLVAHEKRYELCPGLRRAFERCKSICAVDC